MLDIKSIYVYTLYKDYFIYGVIMKILSKPATMLLGILSEEPMNPYGIIKRLDLMNTKFWFYIGNSTVYVTLKNLEKSKYIAGTKAKSGNMPDKTIYTVTPSGLEKLKDTVRQICRRLDYDTTLFSIAATFINIFEVNERDAMLTERLRYLQQYHEGIGKEIPKLNERHIPPYAIANTKRMREIVKAEIVGVQEIIKSFEAV